MKGQNDDRMMKRLGKRVSRRDFLRNAALAGGAAALGSIGAWPRRAGALAPPIGGLPLPLPNPNNAKVDHIIVLMMENRSFDHYFGWKTGTNQQSYLDPNNVSRPTHHLEADYRGCGFNDPNHDWDGGRIERDDGFLAAGTNNDALAIGYYEAQDIEFYAKLAEQFTLCDNYFCSLLGPTFPNREYMHSAQSGGLKTNALPSSPTGFDWLTIWDRLEEAGVPWAYYSVDLPAIALWGPRLAKGARHIEDFYVDAYAGTLPNVVFVDPGFTTGMRTDEHPRGDIRAGQAFSHDVVKAVLESSLWPKTAMFLNYDEWGGFFDSEAPPRTDNDIRATPLDPGGLEDFGQLGFRTPCLILSPYSRTGALSSAYTPTTSPYYEHCSILNFIEWRFGLTPLTLRDQFATNIGELLDFGQDPRLEIGQIVELLPRIPVDSLPCPEDLTETTLLTPEKHAFEVAMESGLFDRMGYKIQLRPLRYAFA